MNSLANRYTKQIGFVMIAVSIFMFMPFVQTVMLASFVAIMEPDTMKLSTYLLTLGESFAFNYFFNIPAIFLLFFGIYGLMRK